MNTTTHDTDAIRQYLLQDLDAERAEELEIQLMSKSSDFEEHLESVEDELIDQFAQDGLGRDEKKRFQARFVWSPERLEKLRLARALLHHQEWSARREARESALRPGVLERLFGWLGELQPAPALSYALASGLLVAAAAVAWLFFGNLQLQRELAIAQQTTTEIASVWLQPGALTRGIAEAERLIVPADATLVRMYLDLGIDDYESYRATLGIETGDEIWSQSQLRADELVEGVAVTLTLPAKLLVPGDYTVRLSGSTTNGDYELIGRYRFRALHE